MKLTVTKEGYNELVLVEQGTNSDILPGRFRNFSGEKRKSKAGKIINDEGKMNFNLRLDLPVEALDQLAAIGLKITELPPTDDSYGDEPLRFVKVNVAFGGKQDPNLYLITDNKKKRLTEKQCALLDGSRFSKVELVMRTYHRDENSTTLYLNNGFFYIEQDPISAKYADFEEIGDEDDEELPF